MRNNLKVLAITSLPTFGNAGLKNIMSILGNTVIPVPTLIACGLGNMEGHKKIAIPFEETLVSTLELARKNNLKLIVYTGYLLDVEQINVIAHNINLYKDNIETIIVDPVCGDNFKAYVSPQIISNFYKLLEIADIVTPNETELRLLTNDFRSSFNEVVKNFTKQFPTEKLIVTSVIENGVNFNALVANKNLTMLPYKSYKASYSGTGDLFVALFIKLHFFDLLSSKDSIIKAANNISSLIHKNLHMKTELHNLLVNPLIQFKAMKTGTLFYVIGPSGVGKDTLLDLAKNNLDNSNVHFAKRYITRSKESGGEDHIPISKDDFKKKIDDSFFSLWWQSHDNYYGISNKINTFLNSGVNVVINGSRGYYNEALKKYPEIKTILITAKETTIKERLQKRGRESIEEIEKRIERSRSFKDFLNRKEGIIVLNNDTDLEISGKNFIDIISQ